MYKKIETCPSCNHPKFENYLICEDHTVSGESFALVRCQNCDLVFTNPRPESSFLPQYYKSDQYISHTDSANSPLNAIYKMVRKYTLSQKYKLVSKYSDKGTILDYGCGTGDFLSVCNKVGWKTIGYEPDDDAMAIALTKSDSRFINQLNLNSEIDVVTAWHVIEHVEDLKSTISNLKKSLINGGYMFIALPNINSLDAGIYKQHWAAYDVPRHLYHFSKQSFQKFITKNKLKLISIEPMVFDSFYVSILSEKYKTGNANYIKAFMNGYKSNRKASKTGEYSSLIYVLQK